MNVIEARVNEKEKNNTTYLRMFRPLQVQVQLILTKQGFNCNISKIDNSTKVIRNSWSLARKLTRGQGRTEDEEIKS